MRVFLDLDGVLNDNTWMEKAKEWFASQHLAWWRPGEDLWRLINPTLAAHVNSLTERTNAQIIISSSHRRSIRPFGALVQIFRKGGITGPIVGETPCEPKSRGAEIQAFLDARDRRDPQLRNFVILDDEAVGESLRSRHVHTQIGVGLTSADVERAIAILASEIR